LVFRILALSLWFSIVFRINYGGDYKTFFQTCLFFIRRPVAISIVIIIIVELINQILNVKFRTIKTIKNIKRNVLGFILGINIESSKTTLVPN